jgi:alpha-glucuronidase
MTRWLALLAFTMLAQAETGRAAWLRYARLGRTARAEYLGLPAAVVAVGDGPEVASAQAEWIRGVQGMLGRVPRIERTLPEEDAVVLRLDGTLGPGAYLLHDTAANGHRMLTVAGGGGSGVLYGVFDLLRRMALDEPIRGIDETHRPYQPIRWVNQWDNLDGSIERGYGGRSLFFEGGNVAADLTRVSEYARLLASIGVNACAINNVNANPRVLAPDFLSQLARVAAAMRPWGVKLAVSVDFASPKTLGGLNTFDPLDPRVAAWWKATTDEVYRAVPDLAGFLLKADSEGRAGPSTYGRTHADAANVIARALAPHEGILVYRAFVYNHHADWRDPKADRARAAYDNFHPLDGKFDANVVLQIKHGPIDFQTREPVSPLLAGLARTNEAMEVQITQEYTGQQRHLVFLGPMWKQVLDFEMGWPNAETKVKELVSGHATGRALGGMVGVANVGRDENWLGSDLAMANLYAFGRLAWDPDLSVERIAEEWARMTFGGDGRVWGTVADLLLASWRTYERYTGPLGAGTLTDILHTHYGPDAGSSEHNGWGQWHRAGHEGIGMDRTVATGTGYTAQYPKKVAAMYESLATCPDNLLLFFHHVPYTYRLHSGNTLIQYVYDVHYQGAAEAEEFARRWRLLRGLVEEDRWERVQKQLDYQAGHAAVWRDDLNAWFFRMSGIPDARGRIGHQPGRIEAEAMTLEGYTPADVHPAEAASGGKAVSCAAPLCRASFRYTGDAGWHTIRVQYFDQNNGASTYRLFLNGQQVDAWTADLRLPSNQPDSNTSTRRSIRGLALRPGDEITVEARPDSGEHAVVDYVEVVR